MEKLERNCAVCGKKLEITVYDNGEYGGGYYFGEIEIPVEGTGEYKKVGYNRELDAEIMKWTGKNKKVEYWECENCYKS